MTDTEIQALAVRFLSGYALVECPLSQCAKRLTTFGAGGYAPFELRETTLDAGRALEYLSLLSWPDSRHVLFPIGDACCALINNSRNGSDYADYVFRLTQHLGARCARVVKRPGRVWSNGTDREVLQWEAYIFRLCGADGEVIRSVDCVNDGGRWGFSEHGDPHPIEGTFPYTARRKRDRFTTERLDMLITAFGLPAVNAASFLDARRYVLFEVTGRPVKTCTIAEKDDPAYGYYQRGLGWLPNMATHATSVIADFERCLRINPAYEPLVRPALEEAYRLTGRS